MMLLASITEPSAVEVASWLGCLFFLVAGWNQVEKFLDRRAGRAKNTEISGQPIEVRLAEEFVRKEEYLERHGENADRIATVKRDLDKLREERREDMRLAALSRKSIYEKIDEAKREMANHTESVRRELSDKIDDVPDRLIATLKNTGAI